MNIVWGRDISCCVYSILLSARGRIISSYEYRMFTAVVRHPFHSLLYFPLRHDWSRLSRIHDCSFEYHLPCFGLASSSRPREPGSIGCHNRQRRRMPASSVAQRASSLNAFVFASWRTRLKRKTTHYGQCLDCRSGHLAWIADGCRMHLTNV